MQATTRLQTSGGASIDPFGDAITAFIGDLSSDPNLSKATTDLKADFGHLLQAQSPSQFFSTLIVTILDTIRTVVISAINVAHALVDSLVQIVEDAFNVVKGILNTALQIPVLTWLYETLFSEPLTILNLLTLVAAIPITLLFRLIEGQYPSQAGLPTTLTADAAEGAAASQLTQPQVAPKPALLAFGIFVGIAQIVQGIANGIGDLEGAGNGPPLAGYFSLVAGTVANVFSFPLLGNEQTDVSSADWAVYGIEVFATISLAAGLPYDKIDGSVNEPASTEFMSFMDLFFGLATLGAAIGAYVKDAKTDGVTNVGFAETIIESITAILNPAKLTPDGVPVVFVFDTIGGVIVAFLNIYQAIANNS